jgi:hypothetical protein
LARAVELVEAPDLTAAFPGRFLARCDRHSSRWTDDRQPGYDVPWRDRRPVR